MDAPSGSEYIDQESSAMDASSGFTCTVGSQKKCQSEIRLLLKFLTLAYQNAHLYQFQVLCLTRMIGGVISGDCARRLVSIVSMLEEGSCDAYKCPRGSYITCKLSCRCSVLSTIHGEVDVESLQGRCPCWSSLLSSPVKICLNKRLVGPCEDYATQLVHLSPM